jgi:hypothetical protein
VGQQSKEKTIHFPRYFSTIRRVSRRKITPLEVDDSIINKFLTFLDA